MEHKLRNRTVIKKDPIVTLDPDTAQVKSSFGANMFYMPHGITIDDEGNTFVTDVGLHQVMRVRLLLSKCLKNQSTFSSSTVSQGLNEAKLGPW